ncbi:MAG: enoyl-CoA hydratase-related protein [Actinomycetota bacterium]
MGEYVTLAVNEGVGTIRIDRPPANAIDHQLGREFGEAVRAASDASVKAVVVWGGPTLFAAGADIKEMADLDPDGIRPVVSALGNALLDLDALDVVTIAAVNGFALGGGCEIALACDLRVVGEKAELGQPEILLGVMPGAGGTQRLPRAVGHARASELLFSGRRVGSQEAVSIGLVHEVVPDGEVYTTAWDRARGYARGPTRALTSAKAALRAARGSGAAELDAEREAFVALFSTEDQREGMKAFLEKRPPRFRGL